MIFFITFFRYFYFCFILLIAFLFLFLRDADSRKGTLCPFCVPIHKKKKKKKKSVAISKNTCKYLRGEERCGRKLQNEKEIKL